MRAAFDPELIDAYAFAIFSLHALLDARFCIFRFGAVAAMRGAGGFTPRCTTARCR